MNTLNNITSILPLWKPIYLFIALFHFHESLHVFSQREYPAQFVLICIFMAQLFRERTYIMMDGRSYIVKNGLVCYSIIILAFNIQTLHYTSEFAGGIYSIWDRPTSASDAYIHHTKCPARWKKKRSRSSRRFSGAIPTIRFNPRSSLLAARYWRTTSHICLLCYQVPRRVGSRWVWWISSMLSAVWRLDGSIWFRYGDNREKFRRLVFYAISSLSNMNNTKVILFKLRTSTPLYIHTYYLMRF